MVYRHRRLIKSEDLNPRGTLFGGQLLKWIDEEAAIFAYCQLETQNVVTKFISAIDFIAPAKAGDVVEIGTSPISIGTSSLTFACEVRNKTTKQVILKIEKIVFVNIDENGKPTPHHIKKIKS